jgi:hypothetical protein
MVFGNLKSEGNDTSVKIQISFQTAVLLRALEKFQPNVCFLGSFMLRYKKILVREVDLELLHISILFTRQAYPYILILHLDSSYRTLGLLLSLLYSFIRSLFTWEG